MVINCDTCAEGIVVFVIVREFIYISKLIEFVFTSFV